MSARRDVVSRAAGLAAALLAAVAAWVQTAAAPGLSLARFLPSGALVTVEARDFARLLADWNGSNERTAWLASDNYRAFSRSKLFLRLAQARDEFAAAAGAPLDLPLLESVAGGESALGLYDIGDLRFVYVSELPAARAARNALWNSRANFEPRQSAGQTYYVRRDTDSGREAAFAVVGERLILATSSDLAAQTVALVAGAGGAAVTADGWYAEAAQAAGPRGELRLVHHLEALARTPHFRSYWVQENVPDLKVWRAGAADLHRAVEGWREERVLLRAPADAPSDPTEIPALAPLLARIPEEAGLYRAWAQADSARAVALLQEKLLDPRPRFAYDPFFAVPPQLGLDAAAALETRIDRPPPSRAAAAFRQGPLLSFFDRAGVRAVLHLQSHRPAPDGALPTNETAIVVETASEEALLELQRAVVESSLGLWTTDGLGAGWTADGALSRLAGLRALWVAVDGRFVGVADSAELLRASLRQRPAPAVGAGAVFAGGFRHASQAEAYRTVMSRIDYLQGGGFERGDDREPNLFSENIGSLSQVLGRVAEVAVERREAGERTEETVRYRMAR